MPNEDGHVTVGELISQLQGHDKNKPIHFGCSGLEFYRVKDRGSAVQIEFNQQVYDGPDGKVIIEDYR